MADGHFYARERGARGEERFFATALTRGPWSNDHQHGGPPTALLARAIERLPHDGDSFVARLTVELLRPIPIAAPLEVVTDVLTSGRTVSRIAAALVSGDQQLAVAVAVRIRVEELGLPIRLPDNDELLRPLEQCPGFEFPFFQHEIGYHTAIEARIADGEFGSGRMAVWMRPRVPLIDGEESSPLQRVMICADAGHGVGTALDTREWSFVNPDLTVQLHRLPSTEWLGMSARTWTEPLGFGVCRTRLSDRRGDLGIVLQSQVIAAARRK
ncbi:MAG TPA: thioesterase family protein [Enhygromyxa sp.]|nr:thioesterase family protein [Enhygromyxa sp.]